METRTLHGLGQQNLHAISVHPCQIFYKIDKGGSDSI